MNHTRTDTNKADTVTTDPTITGSVIDWKLAKELANNDMELAKEILAMLINQLPEHLHIIDQAFQNNDTKQLAQEAHKLHGATCYSGTPRLKQATAELESALHAKQYDKLENIYRQFRTEVDLVMNTYTPN